MSIDIKKLTEKDKGCLVKYETNYKKENGVIKSWNERYIFVVYHYEGDYRNFTAAATNPNDLEFI